MAFSVVDWNLNPNIRWYVVLSDSGSGISVDLYNDHPDNSPPLVASAGVDYGYEIKVTLTQADGSPEDIEKFNETLDFHMKVNGQSGDSTKRFQIGPFVDLPDIEDPIYQSEDLISLRSYKEIHEHTRTKITRNIDLSSYEDEIGVGDVITLDLNREGINENLDVQSFTIRGSIDSVTKSLECVHYERFYKT